MYCHFQVNPKTLISWFRCLINAGNAGWIPNAVFVPLKGTAGRGWYSLSRFEKEWETKSWIFYNTLSTFKWNKSGMKFCMWQTRMSETAMFCTHEGAYFKQFASVSILESWFLNCALWLSSWAFLEEISFSFIPLHFSIICHINVSIVTVFVPNMVLFIFNICSIQNILLTTVVLNHAHFQEQNPAEMARLCFCLSAEWILYFYRVFYKEEYFKREVFQRVVFIRHTVSCLKDTSMIL